MKAVRALVCGAALIAGCGGAVESAGGPDQGLDDTSAALRARPVMAYNGGPIITGTVDVYYIWYGNWSGSGTIPILRDFANALSGSSYYNILTSYYDASGTPVSNSVWHRRRSFDAYSQGTVLQDVPGVRSVQAVVSNAIESGALPYDTNGVYFVLTSADVSVAGPHGNWFCSAGSFAGYHNSFSLYGDRDIKYAFVGDPSNLPCGANLANAVSPNGNPAADEMARLIGHELAEAVTDPLVGYEPAWIVNSLEVGDLCEGQRAARGYVQLGARTFWLQPLFLNNPGLPGQCVFSY